MTMRKLNRFEQAVLSFLEMSTIQTGHTRDQVLCGCQGETLPLPALDRAIASCSRDGLIIPFDNYKLVISKQGIENLADSQIPKL